MDLNYCSPDISWESSLIIIHRTRFLQLIAAVFVLLTLIVAYPTPENTPLWLGGFIVLIGSIISILIFFFPCTSIMIWHIARPIMNAECRYDFLMSIFTSICVPLSTYCIACLPQNKSPIFYIIVSLWYMFLATCFMNNVLLCYDCNHFNCDSGMLLRQIATRMDEGRPLLLTDVEYNHYRAA